MTIKHVALHGLHKEMGARFVDFSGYAMALSYREGVLGEQQRVRRSSGLFDVSHMGYTRIATGRKHASKDEVYSLASAMLQKICPADLAGLRPGKSVYTVLLHKDGGIFDDVIFSRPPEKEGDTTLFYAVFNAARKAEDTAYVARALGGVAELHTPPSVLLALQGPEAAPVLLETLAPDLCRADLDALYFMDNRYIQHKGHSIFLARCGYTGEDGFELAIPLSLASQVTQTLLQHTGLAGLGARDGLRLEAGLCLYGSDMDEKVTPVEAAIGFTIAPQRKKNGDYPGAARMQELIRDKKGKRRVGLRLEKRHIARGSNKILDKNGTVIGEITSGGYSPHLDCAIALAYIACTNTSPGNRVHVVIRNRLCEAEIVKLPFIKSRTRRRGKEEA